MTNPYYNATGNPGTRAAGTSSTMRTEFAAIGTAFDKFATLSGNANKLVVVNAGETAQAVVPVTVDSSGNVAGVVNLTATGAVNFNGGGFTFNETGAAVDARFEGDTDANLLFLDGSADAVGIGTNAPTTKLHVVNATTSEIRNQSGTSIFKIITGAAGYTSLGTVDGSSTLQFLTGDTERMRIDSSGNLAFGTASPATFVHFKKNGAAAVQLVEADITSDAYVRTRTSLGDWAAGTGIGVAADAWSVYDIAAGIERLRITSGGNVEIKNTTSAPGTPSGGGVLYVEGGALKFRGSSGTITTVAPA